MGVRIPQNQIVYKHTAGGEYMFESTYKEYQGPYYEMSGKIFAGKEVTTSAPVLVPIPKGGIEGGGDFFNFNKLLTRAATYVYGKVSKTKIPNSTPSPFYFSPSEEDAQKGQAYRYFTQQRNNKVIKEVNQDNYKELLKNPLFNTIQLKCYIIADLLNPAGNNNYVFNLQDLDNAENKMPGIKLFLTS